MCRRCRPSGFGPCCMRWSIVVLCGWPGFKPLRDYASQPVVRAGGSFVAEPGARRHESATRPAAAKAVSSAPAGGRRRGSSAMAGAARVLLEPIPSARCTRHSCRAEPGRGCAGPATIRRVPPRSFSPHPDPGDDRLLPLLHPFSVRSIAARAPIPKRGVRTQAAARQPARRIRPGRSPPPTRWRDWTRSPTGRIMTSTPGCSLQLAEHLGRPLRAPRRDPTASEGPCRPLAFEWCHHGSL